MKEVNLLIDRLWKKPEYTIGRFYVNGEFLCNSLEDPDRGLAQYMNVGEIDRIKVKGNTAIPTGTYRVLVTYSPRFKKMMPQIIDVPGFTGVRIHAGNGPEDTEGCPLLGMNKIKGRLVDSRYWVSEFMKRIEGADVINITIQ